MPRRKKETRGRKRIYPDATTRQKAYLDRIRKARKLWDVFLIEVQAQEAIPEWLDSFIQREVLPIINLKWSGIQTIEGWLQFQKISGDQFSRKILKTEIPLWCYSEDWTLDNEKVEEELMLRIQK